MSKEEEEIERLFKDWEKQFAAWKQQYQNHPDKEAFAQNEKQWQDWGEQLFQKREEIKKAKGEQMANAVATQPIMAASVVGAQPHMFGATTAAPAGAVPPVNYNQMSKEEEEIERLFKDWEKQFAAWKQQYQNHPDKEAFAQNEKQWQDWGEQLFQKREEIKKAKGEQMANAVATQPIMATSVVGAQPHMFGAPTAAPAGAVPPVNYMDGSPSAAVCETHLHGNELIQNPALNLSINFIINIHQSSANNNEVEEQMEWE